MRRADVTLVAPPPSMCAMTAGALEELPLQVHVHDPGDDAVGEPAALDADWLAGVLPRARAVHLEQDWWDGARRVPCLYVACDRSRYRLVPLGRWVLILPASGRAARRSIAAWRRGRAMPVLPAPEGALAVS